MRARLPSAAALALGVAFVASCGGAGGADLDSGAVDGAGAVDGVGAVDGAGAVDASTPDASVADA